MAETLNQYLKTMDDLRDKSDENIDDVFASIDVKTLMADPEKHLKVIALATINKNKKLFRQAAQNGELFADALER